MLVFDENVFLFLRDFFFNFSVLQLIKGLLLKSNLFRTYRLISHLLNFLAYSYDIIWSAYFRHRSLFWQLPNWQNCLLYYSTAINKNFVHRYWVPTTELNIHFRSFKCIFLKFFNIYAITARYRFQGYSIQF